MQPDPPAHIPDGARAVVLASRHVTRGRAGHTYRLWLVDAQRWTVDLHPPDAHHTLVSEGYTPNRARQLLAQARSKAANEAAAQKAAR